TAQPPPSPFDACRNMIRQNMNPPSYAGLGGRRKPNRPRCAAAVAATQSPATSKTSIFPRPGRSITISQRVSASLLQYQLSAVSRQLGLRQNCVKGLVSDG